MRDISVDFIFPEMAHLCNVEKHLLVMNHDGGINYSTEVRSLQKVWDSEEGITVTHRRLDANDMSASCLHISYCAWTPPQK
jgi:hypothetical protein